MWRKIQSLVSYRRVDEYLLNADTFEKTKNGDKRSQNAVVFSPTFEIYIAADNSRVKKSLQEYLNDALRAASNTSFNDFRLHFVSIRNEGVIRHGAYVQSFDRDNLYNFNLTRSNHSDLFDLSLDWYALAMSSHVLR